MKNMILFTGKKKHSFEASIKQPEDNLFLDFYFNYFKNKKNNI